MKCDLCSSDTYKNDSTLPHVCAKIDRCEVQLNLACEQCESGSFRVDRSQSSQPDQCLTSVEHCLIQGLDPGSCDQCEPGYFLYKKELTPEEEDFDSCGQPIPHCQDYGVTESTCV